jgi:hypothetical protein
LNDDSYLLSEGEVAKHVSTVLIIDDISMMQTGEVAVVRGLWDSV